MTNRKYTPEFRTFVLNRCDAGESPAVLEKEFGLTKGQVSKWNWHRHNDTPVLIERASELDYLREENAALRRALHFLTT